MRLLLFCALVAAVAAAPVSHRHQHVRELTRTPCAYCQDVVSTLEDFVADPQTQAAITHFVEDSVCTGLPDAFADICTQEVPALVSQAAQELQEALDPKDVCGVAGLCPGASAAQLLGLEAPASSATPWDCPVCKMVVMTFVQRLQDREKRQEIEEDMRAACDTLAPEAKARCLQDVTNLFAALDDLLRDVDPEGVCHVVDFCSPHPPADAPALSGGAQAAATLRAALKQLASGAPAAAGAQPGNDMCQNCKTIVLEAAAILQDPKTQAELLEYAKEGCTIFQDFKDQCEQYVTLYGPLVFNMLITYLQPDALCTRIGYCTSVARLVVS